MHLAQRKVQAVQLTEYGQSFRFAPSSTSEAQLLENEAVEMESQRKNKSLFPTRDVLMIDQPRKVFELIHAKSCPSTYPSLRLSTPPGL
mmetsp:Transcript_10200/g.20578  ORF Transcript_10200/g.20578 Transcript_10200/m.20578 type:complete len:89 (-) Transcript_10200:77-343(-)